MRAVGQESKYRGLVHHPFTTPLVPFILRLTRPLAESILPRISFSRIYMSRCSKSMKYGRATSRWTHISLQFTREAPFISSRLPIRGRGDKDSWIAVCLSLCFFKIIENPIVETHLKKRLYLVSYAYTMFWCGAILLLEFEMYKNK